MASQPQRVRKPISPGTTTKQGPIKATLPVALMQQNTNYSPTKNTNNPSKSPVLQNWRADVPCSKSKEAMITEDMVLDKSFTVKTAPSSSFTCKTSSPDASCIETDPTGCYVMDRTTQTPEEWEEENVIQTSKVLTGDPLEMKYIRQCLQRSTLTSPLPRNSPVPGDHSAITPPGAIPIPAGPRSLPRMRNSVEGLNQEIEKLVFKGLGGSEREIEPIPDGHRAPIAEMLISSSQNHSISPLVSNCSNGWSSTEECLSPDPSLSKLGTSPQLNKFSTREPPDGCERVKIVEDRRDLCLEPGPLLSSYILLPSQGSAFCPPRH